MLESAWLRVIILDSSKLAAEDGIGSKVFAKLSNHLVVTDDGGKTKAKDEVRKFTEIVKSKGKHRGYVVRSAKGLTGNCVGAGRGEVMICHPA